MNRRDALKQTGLTLAGIAGLVLGIGKRAGASETGSPHKPFEAYDPGVPGRVPSCTLTGYTDNSGVIHVESETFEPPSGITCDWNHGLISAKGSMGRTTLLKVNEDGSYTILASSASEAAFYPESVNPPIVTSVPLSLPAGVRVTRTPLDQQMAAMVRAQMEYNRTVSRDYEKLPEHPERA
jgi:hypothetical protein